MAKKKESTILDYNIDDFGNKLKDEHKLYCERLIVNGGNETKSYMEVYPDAKYESAMVNGSKLLRNANIKTYYSLLRQQTSARNQISAKWLYDKHKSIIDSAPDDFMNRNEIIDKDGNQCSFIEVKKFEDIPEDKKWLIQEIKQTRDGIQVKLLDKQKSLDALAKIGAHYTENIDLNAKQEVIIRSATESKYMNKSDK